MGFLRKRKSSGLIFDLIGVAAIAFVLVLIGALVEVTTSSAKARTPLPAPRAHMLAQPHARLETAVLAGGCFWGMEDVFQHVKGVTSVVSGYSGGKKSTANYDTVSSGDTGHAESVKITFNPQRISYGKLLQIYFSVAQDPTQLNRQGPDRGKQYRSDIFYANAGQERVAKAYIAQLEKAHAFQKPIVTRIDPLQGFYPAEAYHQDFAYHHPHNLYIVINDAPKVKDLKRLFPGLYREQPAIDRSD